MKEFYGKISFVGRASFSIEDQNIENAGENVFEDIVGLELILKDGTKLQIQEIDWELIEESRRGNVGYSQLRDFEIFEEK